MLSLVDESMEHREKGTYGVMNKCIDLYYLLLALWAEKEFKRQIRVKYIIFNFLYKRLGPKKNKNKKTTTCFRVIVLVQERIAVLLHELGRDDGLQTIQGLYGVHKSILKKIIRNFYRVVRKYL
jgi:hypothetical protein